MNLTGENILLRIYLRTADRTPHAPTYERLLHAARAGGLGGATILKGILGYGTHGISRPRPLSLLASVPVIVEIVDTPDRIGVFVAGPIRRLGVHGMATLERAGTLMYRRRSQDQPDEFQLAAPVRPLSTLPQIQPGVDMTLHDDGILLRIFIGESDRIDRLPLYEAILHKARELGLAGATVLRGIEGFGANSIVHKSSLLDMSSDLPIIIEIVDRNDAIRRILPYLRQTVRDGMITMEYVAIIHYRHNPEDSPVSPPA